ncbi:MAG: hypothetical protein HLUCCO07_00375 [Rhodobacteraceae bacterium HLUCCO07]|nr:MAG: hypothetical protein HLUCCO07_00375 [Rhodobacteraceae bacterium HLUCCO07]
MTGRRAFLFDAALFARDVDGTLDQLNDKWFKPSRDI